jgi:hypothetical protein
MRVGVRSTVFDWGRPEGRKLQKKENGIGWKVMIPTGKRDSGQINSFADMGTKYELA